MGKPKIISSKSAVQPLLKELAAKAGQKTTITRDFWDLFESEVLRHKVKFPVLESVATALYGHLSYQQVNELMDLMAEARHISCYPVIGKLLQFELKEDLVNTYDQAIKHIIKGDEWYVCDIISERVFGEGTLRYFDKSLTLLTEMGDHDNFWIQRSIGIASHYATKKKLAKQEVEKLWLLMIRHAWKTHYFTKKGIGWAGKTIAKHHPDLVEKHMDLLKATKLSGWFVTKVNIGLSMSKAPFRYERD